MREVRKRTEESETTETLETTELAYTALPEAEAGRPARGAEAVRDEYALREVKRFLSDYRAAERMLGIERCEEGDGYGGSGLPRDTAILLKARMFEIRSFVLSIEDCDEKLFLYYHYVYGETIERCAELLSVSRSTVYRIRRRALYAAAVRYEETRRRAE